MEYALIKNEVDQNDLNEQRRARRHRFKQIGLPVILCFVSLWLIVGIPVHQCHKANDGWAPIDYGDVSPGLCPNYPVIDPSNSDLTDDLNQMIDDSLFLNQSAGRLTGAVNIPTQSFDDMGGPLNVDDPRWQPFSELHDYLKRTFPKVHDSLELEFINTYGLLYTWEGSNKDLKPLLLMAHQDVVPVLKATENSWKFPPFSGHFDGELVWGRGASDCKNTLISIYEAVEFLIQKGFKPTRTVILSFGYDEEISGFHGAASLSKSLEDKYGRHSISLIIDEGPGLEEQFGTLFALPGLSEKGYIDVNVTVTTPGGHSSIPTDHTAIGILASLITEIESTPYKPQLTPRNPIFTFLQCAAQHAPDLSRKQRRSIKKAAGSRRAAAKLAKRIASQSLAQRYLLQTSQATDIIAGGVKVNALPENVYAIVNHRIAVESSPEDVRKHLQALFCRKASRLGLSLDAFGKCMHSKGPHGQIILSEFRPPLEPAPLSPAAGKAYEVLSGTIKHIWNDAVVAPAIMTGNTDTKYYWNLTENIYRFSKIYLDVPISILTYQHR